MPKRDHSSFLDSFTFDKGNNFCDCDECGLQESVIPAPIASAIRDYKQQQQQQQALVRSQSRSLVQRQASISVYDYHFPLHVKEPIVEFGNSHRLVWVQRKSSTSVLSRLGTGIIGSSLEEERRTVLDWQQNVVYFVPCNGGKAIGWVHTTSVDSNEPSPIVLRIAKIPTTAVDLDLVTENEREEETNNTDTDKEERNKTPTTQWSDQIIRRCRDAIRKTGILTEHQQDEIRNILKDPIE